ncbi:DUF3127 domain-containing protein [Marinilabiliaceae bacterium ANBcel2]|nr:DUF3127 domain-containing protein [Marinilabiliaceae bacterium ANBcel2]
MSFEISGTLIVKEDTVTINSNFQKREFVIEVANERNPEWNDFVKFQLIQDKCSLIDQYNLKDNIKVLFNIKGKRWERDGKVNYFTNLQAWKIEGENSPSKSDETPPPYKETDIPPAEPEDELPF